MLKLGRYIFFPPEPAQPLQTASFLERKMEPQKTVFSYSQWGINVKIMSTHRENISGGGTDCF